MSLVHRVGLSLGTLALFTAGLVPGCGGDDSAPVIPNDTDGGIVANDSGGGDDGSAASDGGSGLDGTAGDGSPGDAGDPYCAALASYDKTCSLTGACATARLAQCPQAEAVLSDAYQAAYADCVSLDPCPNADPDAGAGGPRRSYQQCITAHVGAISSAQKKLTVDYCARCEVKDAGTCEADFFKTFGNLYGLTDKVTAAIAATCAAPDAGAPDASADGGAAECAKEFDRCARDVVAKASPPRPAECAADGG